ncbi:PREDICTED: PWWP domain-containing protein MUM1 isoform X1 [Galeopterus variegatus]|uniref:PWWP domain-containing protein MUM1 isoform X1 n=1 Tax=Galeopterus variegatus TaxID=482537 RepID=A0ABM0QD04_GALVR|nr:PREDICTED: PWWP domain-containing protein MUM1 isoform X1 [Galeopterus variegatus]XP_008566246.1 PREDICTED: PWWP domain-containing protein MUM1 isoform X1 [Galeopterus variegatus]
MTDAKYVLCRWKRRLWPAKVLARTKTSTKNKRKKEFFLDVQIISLEKKIKVKSTEVETLQESQIDDIASSLVLADEVPAAPLEELTYRRSLRVALDVLKEKTSLCQESSSREDRKALFQSPRKPTDPASLLCDSGSSSLLGEDVLDSSGPGRRRVWAQQSLSVLSTCEEDPECRVDHKKGLRKSENPTALLVPSAQDGSQDGSGPRIHHKNQTIESKRGRNSTQKSILCQNIPLPSEGDDDKESEKKAGGWTAPSSPSRVREDDPCARAEGHDPGLPSGSLTVLPAQAGGRPVKRPRLDGSRRQRPQEHRALRNPARPGLPTSRAPVEETRCRLVDSEKPEEDRQSSEEPVEIHSVNSILEEDEEDEEPPRMLLYHEPRSFEAGMLVWLKYQKYPFWPAVIKSIRRRDKKASVLFIEGHMDPKGKGITVSLRRLKHFDCKEKQTLLNTAKEDFKQAIGWCVSLITDYRVRLGCGSFAGSFLEYYAADISYPVRKSIQQDVLGTTFPQLSKGDPKEPVAGSPLGWRPPCRKLLPDRARAARDRANRKLVEYIVKAKGAESHLRAVLKGRKPSRWLEMFLSSSQYVTCVETYLEDEEQLDLVVKYLQRVYQETDSKMRTHVNGDRIRFILDVLLPEAIICAISAVDTVDYKTAEEKYIKGPLHSYRHVAEKTQQRKKQWSPRRVSIQSEECCDQDVSLGFVAPRALNPISGRAARPCQSQGKTDI